jgi:hypothetical protein
MTHLLVIVLLIVFIPIALATVAPLLALVVRLAIAPFFGIWLVIYGLYHAPGAIVRGVKRTSNWIRRDIAKTKEFSCFKNLGGTIAICLVITLILMPLFPL